MNCVFANEFKPTQGIIAFGDSDHNNAEIIDYLINHLDRNSVANLILEIPSSVQEFYFSSSESQRKEILNEWVRIPEKTFQLISKAESKGVKVIFADDEEGILAARKLLINHDAPGAQKLFFLERAKTDAKMAEVLASVDQKDNTVILVGIWHLSGIDNQSSKDIEMVGLFQSEPQKDRMQGYLERAGVDLEFLDQCLYLGEPDGATIPLISNPISRNPSSPNR